jgi:hypothetical protein
MTTPEAGRRAAEEVTDDVLAEAIKRIIDGGCGHDREKACRPCVVSRGVKHLRRTLATAIAQAVQEEREAVAREAREWLRTNASGHPRYQVYGDPSHMAEHMWAALRRAPTGGHDEQ